MGKWIVKFDSSIKLSLPTAAAAPIAVTPLGHTTDTTISTISTDTVTAPVTPNVSLEIDFVDGQEQSIFLSTMEQLRAQYAATVRARNPNIEVAAKQPASAVPAAVSKPVIVKPTAGVPIDENGNPLNLHPTVASHQKTPATVSQSGRTVAQNRGAIAPMKPVRGAPSKHTPPSPSLMRRPQGMVPNVGAVQGPAATNTPAQKPQSRFSTSAQRRGLAPMQSTTDVKNETDK